MRRSSYVYLDDGTRAAALLTTWLLRGLALAVLIVPLALVLVLSFSRDTYMVIPPTGFSLKWYANIPDATGILPGFLASLGIAAVVTLIGLILGTLAAYAIWRSGPAIGKPIEVGFTLPIIVPTVVTGVALLIMLSNLRLYNAFWNIVLGHTIIALPFVVRSVLVALTRYNRRLDEAATGLGASPIKVFFRITLPQVRTGIFAGGIFAFVVSFDDFAITIFLVNPKMIPLPVAMYDYIQWSLDQTLTAISAVLILIAIAAALAVDRLIGLDRFIGIRD